MKSFKNSRKIISVISSLALLLNSLAAPISVLAQEASPSPTSTATESTTPPAENENTPTPTITVIPTETPTITPTPTITATPVTEESKDDQGQVNIIVTDDSQNNGDQSLNDQDDILAPDLTSPPEETSAQLNPGLTTNKSDYSPTDQVLISGSDFLPNTEYEIVITSDTGNFKFSDRVSSDESGGLFYSYQLDGTYRPEYKVEIFDLSGKLIISTSFTDTNDNKVTICHATSSNSNPYIENRPNKSGDLNGHTNHDGPVWQPDITEPWGDIIPPFDYDGGSYPGKNWVEGRAIWDNDCEIPGQTAFCGDGIVNQDSEECDLGDYNGSSSCTNDCTLDWQESSCPTGDSISIGVFDQFDAGDSDSEASHSAVGWGADPGSGNYGGRDNGGTFSLVVGKDECNDNGRSASFTMDVGSGHANKLSIRHLDGLSNRDSFDVFVDGNFLAHYTDGNDSEENWMTSDFPLPNITGSFEVEIQLTDDIWGSCSTYGQLAINWIKAGGYECEPQIPSYQCNETIYATNNNRGFYYVDSTTGVLTDIGTTLNFGSSASADDPFNSRTYYVNRYHNDVLAYYDHSIDTHYEIGDLNVDNFFTKLAFNIYGELYGLTDAHQLYQINPSTAETTLIGTISGIGTGGDIVFDEMNTLYLIGTDGKLYSVSLPGLTKTLITNTGIGPVTGLAYLNGQFYFSSTNAVYRINKNGTGFTLLSSQQPQINDLSSCLPGQERPTGRLQGTKYYDYNANGIHDINGGETNYLNGWTIRLYDKEWNFVEETVTSNLGNKGQYRFDVEPGKYNVCEVAKDGWKQTGPVLGAESIDNDHNPTGNGVAVENQSGEGDEGSVCWQADLEEGERDGWLKFGNIQVSDVNICKLNEARIPLPSWTMGLLGEEMETVNVPVDTSTTYSSPLALGDYVVLAQGTYRFANWGDAGIADAGYSLRIPGRSYSYHSNPYNTWVSGDDLGTPGGLELKINGADIDWGYFNPEHNYLHSLLGYSGKIGFSIYDNYIEDNDNSGDNPLRATIYKGYAGVTGEDGCATFEDVPYGEYTLDEINKDGWENVSGLGVVDINDRVENFTVVNRELLGDLRVCKFEDMNANRIQDDSDPFIAWDMTVKRGDEVLDAVDRGEDGCYLWQNLPVGEYTVAEGEVEGWMMTNGGVEDIERDVTVSDGEPTDVYFGNFKLGEITVCKYDDYNGDGKLDEGEPGIEGVSVTLEKEASYPEYSLSFEKSIFSTEEDNTKKTQEDGCYTFSNLKYGTYRVKEDLNGLPGYMPTDDFSTDGNYRISNEMVVTSGYTKKVDFFDELQPIKLSVTKDNNGPAITAGAVMGYTLTVANDAESTAYDVTVTDNMPYGFTYVADSALVDGSVQNPSISGSQLNWTVDEIPAGESIIITYNLLAPNDLGIGSFWNVAYATGYNRPIGGEDSEKSESDVVASYLTKGITLSYSTGVGGSVLGMATGEVLGASTELPATGSQTIVLGVLVALFILGLIMKFTDDSKKKRVMLFVKNAGKKARKIMGVFVVTTLLLLSVTGKVKAINDTVYLQDLPTYLNTSDFTISYTGVSDNSITAKFLVRKDGDSSWREVGNTNGVSGQVDVDGGDIYGGDGKYFFKVEINSGAANDETFTNIDRSAPDPVRDYRKEKKGDGWYKLLWKNPDNEDYDKVIIYRSDQKNFTADSSTEVATMWGSRNSDMTMENSAAPGKEYYFALRAIDKAGNASSMVADPETTTVVYEETTVTPTPVAGEGEVKILPQEEKKGEVLGEKEEASKDVEASPTPSGSSKPGALKEVAQFAKDRTKITVGIIAVILFAGYFGYTKLLKKKD